MREFTRIALRLGMILILLGGCVHNIYHFAQFANNQSLNHQPRYFYSNQSYSNTLENVEEEQKVETTTTNNIDVGNNSQENFYYGY